MRAFKAEGGVVKQVIITDGSIPPGYAAVPSGKAANVGDTVSGSDFISPRATIIREIPEISPLQCKAQAVADGEWSALKEAIEGADLWEDFILSKIIKRDSPQATLIQAALTKTDAEMDAFFLAAARAI